MAATIIIDTHKFVTELTEAGMAPEQAEALASQFQTNLTELATREDVLLSVKELRSEMKQLEQRLTIRMGAIAAVVIAAVTALDKLIA